MPASVAGNYSESESEPGSATAKAAAEVVAEEWQSTAAEEAES